MSSTLTPSGWVVEQDVVDERKEVPRLTGAQIDALNARIAAGSKEFPTATTIIRIDDEAVFSKQGTGLDARFINVTGTVVDAVTKPALASSAGSSTVGAVLETSSTGIALPPQTVEFFVRSSDIDVRAALPGNFVTDGTVDYSVEMQKIWDYCRDFGGGRVRGPAKLMILVGAQTIYSGTEIVFPEWTGGFVIKTGGYGFSVNPGSGGTTNPDDNQRNIYLGGFQIRGQNATPVFDQQRHFLNLNAISSSLFEDLKITGHIGDGVYLGSSNTGGVERHNERITFRRITADGVNRENRNVISIIDGTDVVIDGLNARRCVRSDMPSVIDIEPNANAFHRLRNISIENVYIEDSRAGYFFQVLNNLTNPASRISFSKFKMVNVDVPLALAGSYATTPLTKTDPVQNVIIEKGSATGGVTPIILYGQQGALIQAVNFDTFTGSAAIGDSVGTTRLRSFGVTIRDTNWTRCGTTSGSALKVSGITDFEYIRNRHLDCGDDTATGAAVEMSPAFTGSLTVARFKDNNFEKSALTNMQAVKKTGGGALTFAVRNVAGNVYNGLATIFYDAGSAAIPTTGTAVLGDFVSNNAAAAGGFSGWTCTTAGTPGTWKTSGAISP